MSQYRLFIEFKDSLKESKDTFNSYNKLIDATIFFQEHLCSIQVFNRELLPNIINSSLENVEDILSGLCRKIDFTDKNPNDLLLQIMYSGLMIYYDHKRNIFLLIDISQALRRSTSDSLLEPKNILGSRDGFTENFKDNIALMRLRLKSSNLMLEEKSIGRRSKTYLGVMYVDDIHSKDKLAELLELLDGVDIDALLSADDLMNHKNFKNAQAQYVGSPDLAVKYLLSGQFVLIMDRIPLVVVLPTTLGIISKLRVDEVGSNINKLFQKTLVLLALLSSLLLPGLLVSFLTFQSDTLPLTLLSTLLVTQKGAILPPELEVLFILLLFEFYYLISFRSSEATISGTVVLVGGLIIGQNAINSGIVGVIVMTLVSLSFLSTFAISNNISFISKISILRLVNLASAFFFGIYGLTLCIIINLITIANKKFLGVNFTSPLIPFNFNDIKLLFFARTSSLNKNRLDSMQNKDRTAKK